MKIMRRAAILLALFCAAAANPPGTRADYAVLKSGARLHITSYEQTGDRMKLMVPGGVVEVAASEVASVEPEENFAPNPPAAPADDANAALGNQFGKLIHDAAAKHGVAEDLVKDVIAAESNFNPRAVSRKQAQGLMQLLPETAARYSVMNIFDPAQNIDAGTHYLKDLLAQYGGNLPLALAAYNAGPLMVERYGGVPPFRETQSYVKKITANLASAKKKPAGSVAKHVASTPTSATAKAKIPADPGSAKSAASTAGLTGSAADPK
jgi:soluble lytic murein transglycosylase-like protein